MNITDLARDQYWLIILNVEIPAFQDINSLWNNAFKIICLDGAVDRIKSHFEHKVIKRGPDFVIGDLDSVSTEAIKWLNSKFGSNSYVVSKVLDQDTTDFDKALKFIQENTEETPSSIVALNSFGGRLDHTLAVLNSAHAFESKFPFKVQLMNESCIARIIYQDSVTIEYPKEEFVDHNCGIIPLFGPVDLDSTGLKWEIDGRTLQFSGLISTSNCVTSSIVHLVNKRQCAFVWTHEI